MGDIKMADSTPLTIIAPGVYDISAAEYHADPCATPSLSSSIGKLLVTPGGTPRRAWWDHPRLNPDYVSEESDKFDLGNAAHAIILRSDSDFTIVDAPDWRTKTSQERRLDARATGKIPILEKHWHNVVAMGKSAALQIAAHKDAAGAFLNGRPEQTLVWCEGDVWCRARLDWLPFAGIFYDDYKSTAASADPDLWGRTMFGMGADFQAAFYLRGIRALGLCDRPQFRFIVQENYPPYLLSVIALDPDTLDIAERDVARAIDIWGRCLRSGEWPGYQDRTCYVGSPPWRIAQKLEREAREYPPCEADIARGDAQRAPL